MVTERWQGFEKRELSDSYGFVRVFDQIMFRSDEKRIFYRESSQIYSSTVFFADGIHAGCADRAPSAAEFSRPLILDLIIRGCPTTVLDGQIWPIIPIELLKSLSILPDIWAVGRSSQIGLSGEQVSWEASCERRLRGLCSSECVLFLL